MDSEKHHSEKKSPLLKPQAERLPVIQQKKVYKEKTYCKKSPNTLLKPKLNLPRLKYNEISLQRADAGEPGDFSYEFLNQETNSPLASSVFGVDSRDVIEKPLKSEDFRTNARVVGISECNIEFKVPSSELITDDLETKEEELEESNAFKRWKFWLKDKVHMQNILSRKLGRNPCDLQIQESDKYRALFEDKLLLTYAQIPEPDKWRGHPFHWKQKMRLGPSKIPDDSEIPVYVTADMKLDEGDLPEMEFIGIPDAIQKEKDRTCRFENYALKKWEKMPYRQEQISRFRNQRKKLKPRDIPMDQLAIVGAKITEEKPESKESLRPQNVPEIIVTEDDSDCSDFRQSIFCLDIDGEEIKYELGTENCQNPDKAFTWQVDFGANKIGSLVEKVLRVENRGTVAVAYDWVSQKNERKRNLDVLQLKNHEPWFFFNKNSGIFLPGQIYDLKFYHYSEASGIRKEVWYIKTRPPLWKNQETGTIVFSAVATEDISCKKYAVDSFLKKRVGDAVVRFAIEIILNKVFNPSEGLRDIEYRSLFHEKELFEYHNPKHYYHSSIVKELNGLFNKIPCKNQTEWDLSLSSLVSIVKTSTRDEEQNEILQRIADDSRKLFRPNYLLLKKCNRYKMTKEILCKTITLIEEDYNYFKNLLFPKKEEFRSNSSFQMDEASEENFIGIPMMFEVKPLNYMFFQTILYTKVYGRLCEAVESIAGMIETNKLLQPWKQGREIVKPTSRTH